MTPMRLELAAPRSRVKHSTTEPLRFVRKHSYLEHGYLGGCSRGQNLGRQAYAALKCSNEPQHEISNNVVCATSKASDQPAHTRSLIRAFASRLNIL